jgi:hypothetical protein
LQGKHPGGDTPTAPNVGDYPDKPARPDEKAKKSFQKKLDIIKDIAEDTGAFFEKLWD